MAAHRLHSQAGQRWSTGALQVGRQPLARLLRGYCRHAPHTLCSYFGICNSSSLFHTRYAVPLAGPHKAHLKIARQCVAGLALAVEATVHHLRSRGQTRLTAERSCRRRLEPLQSAILAALCARRQAGSAGCWQVHAASNEVFFDCNSASRGQRATQKGNMSRHRSEHIIPAESWPRST